MRERKSNGPGVIELAHGVTVQDRSDFFEG